MIVSVLERRSEIGLRRALGATEGQIRAQFLGEAILLALIGGRLDAAPQPRMREAELALRAAARARPGDLVRRRAAAEGLGADDRAAILKRGRDTLAPFARAAAGAA